MIETKACPSCKDRYPNDPTKWERPKTSFWKSKSSPDGLYGYCKECAADKNRKRYSRRVPTRRNKRYEEIAV